MLARKLSLILCGLLVASARAVDAQAQDTFTLEQVMSAPFPSGLVAAPAGAKVAWVLNERGARNIWVAEAPDFAARRLTAYADDDGQAISDLSWSPNGAAVVYVRGGDANRRGEYPNPLSLPGGVKQEIWVVGLGGEAPRKLADGSSLAVAPTAGRVAFLKGGEAWSVELAGGEPAALLKARGTIGSLRWSPDGTRLAFVSNRGDHSFVGVLDVETGSVRWLEPSVDRDIAPAWSPDGGRIAFVRIPAAGAGIVFGPERSGPPWSIHVADASDGRSRVVWTADEGPGSVFQGVAAESELFWAAGGRIVFPWEKDGWLHLYSLPATGGAATLLTPGAFEVEHVALSADRTRVIYSSNQDDIDRRHLWSVAAAGGTPSALTRGAGIEWSPVPLAEGGAIAFLRSDAHDPARPALRDASGRMRDLAPETLPRDFPAAALLEPEAVTFPAADGMTIRGQLFMPERCRRARNCPGVLFFHGGSRRQMLLGWHYLGYYHNAYALNQYLAGRGYVVLSVNYRSGTGYGLEFREALNFGATGASEYNDIVGAGLYLKGRPEVDPARIGLWGGSYGGYLTALGLARASDLFAAGVDFHGVHDWNVVIRNFVQSYDPLERQDVARLAFESSPMAAIETWRSPVLLIHGDDDRNVPFSETVELVTSLRRQGVELEQLIFPDEVHSFLTHARWLEAYRATADFFDRKLGGR
jgi:dipeptidyl aminopeptidase/acylaminoacyl peptidase